MPADRVVCTSCGSIIPIEHLTEQGRQGVRRAVGGALNLFGRRRSLWLLWLLASLPFTIIPPVAAIAIILLRWAAVREIAGNDRVLFAIVLFAAINIIGSAILLATLSNELLTVLQDISQGWPLRTPVEHGGRVQYL